MTTIYYATAAKQIVGHFASENAAQEAAERYSYRHNLPTKAILISPHHVYRTAAQHEREYLSALRDKVISRLTEDEKAALSL